MECDTESRDLLENHTAGPLFTFRRRRWRSRALPANAGWQISEPPPSPGFPSAGPAVIFLMISLFCRKSLSLGETRHFRPGETWGWAGLRPGPGWDPVRLQPHHKGPTHPFIPPVSLLSFFPLSTQSSVEPFSLPAPICPPGAQLCFSVVIVYLWHMNDYLAFLLVTHNSSSATLIKSHYAQCFGRMWGAAFYWFHEILIHK